MVSIFFFSFFGTTFFRRYMIVPHTILRSLKTPYQFLYIYIYIFVSSIYYPLDAEFGLVKKISSQKTYNVPRDKLNCCFQYKSLANFYNLYFLFCQWLNKLFTKIWRRFYTPKYILLLIFFVRFSCFLLPLVVYIYIYIYLPS